MPMKTPQFWYEHRDHLSWGTKLLIPLSWLYGIGHALHQWMGSAQKMEIPILCVGNLTAGGSGKTPSAIALMELIKDKKLAKAPAFLTRGYGGDEEQILQKSAPVFINADRVAGARNAIMHEKDLIVMDDGLQNPSIHKDIRFVVVDGIMGFGNGKMIPAGPMRTPLDKALNKADAFIFVGEDTRMLKPLLPDDKPVFQAQIKPTVKPKANKYLAFAGLGYPEKFFSFLRDDMDLEIVESVPFRDHHPYSPQDIFNLQQRAKALGVGLITTEKDFVKIPEDMTGGIEFVPIQLVWHDEKKLLDFLKSRLEG